MQESAEYQEAEALEEEGELFKSFTSKKKANLAEALLTAHMEKHMNAAEHGPLADLFDVFAAPVGDDQGGADQDGDEGDWEEGLSDGEYGRALAVLAEEERAAGRRG